MKQHLDLMNRILEDGTEKGDRTGTGTMSMFGGMSKYSIQHNLWPIPTTREVNHKHISAELEWMIKGMISVQWLKDNDVPIWNSWAGDKTGTIGPMYGEQWRNWNAESMSKNDRAALQIAFDELEWEKHQGDIGSFMIELRAVMAGFFNEKTKPYEQGGRGGTDQLKYVAEELKNNPDSRRIAVSIWHAGLLPESDVSPKDNADNGKMALAPCHSMWQVDTKQLTDMEILREIVYQDEKFKPTIEEALADYATMASTEVVKLISFNASVFAVTKGWCELMKEEVSGHQDARSQIAGYRHLDAHRDRNYLISAEGRILIDQYKASGKPTRKLSLLCFARSQDVPLGTVYNQGMYSLMAKLLASQTNMIPWEYTHFMGDHHIYRNQVPFVEKQLTRTPMKPCRVYIDPELTDITQFDHKKLVVDYVSHEKIVFPRAAV